MARKGGTPENLIPAKKGDVRNPNGRPKGALSRSTIVRHWLDSHIKGTNPITGEEVTLPASDMITLAIIAKAKDGDVQAFKELMDSGFGKVTDQSDVRVRMQEFSIKDIYNEKTQEGME